MTTTSHALSGVAIALTLKEPALALPLSFISHFVLDMLPHFGFRSYEERQRHRRIFKTYIKAEVILPFLVFAAILLFGLGWLAFFCALFAILPDLVWAHRFLFLEKRGKEKPPEYGVFTKFHKKIQRYEFLGGFFVEFAFALLMVITIVMLKS